MKTFFLTHWLKFAGIGVGVLGGYLYYYYVGCASGMCAIKSNPYLMMLYGALIGYLLVDLVRKKPDKKKSDAK